MLSNEGRKAHLVGSAIANLAGAGMPVNAETKFWRARGMRQVT